MSIRSCTHAEMQRKLDRAKVLSLSCCAQIICPISHSHTQFGFSEYRYCLSPFNSLAHSACLSISFMSIKVPLNPLLRSHNVNVEQKDCIQVRASGVWGYSAEISHWRKVNMVVVMRLEPDWECRRGHMGLIMAQLYDSEAVFIDLTQARILQTLETPSMLMKPTLEIAPW